ncbi:unnamed protein product, partial [Pleuronectes platessa]
LPRRLPPRIVRVARLLSEQHVSLPDDGDTPPLNPLALSPSTMLSQLGISKAKLLPLPDDGEEHNCVAYITYQAVLKYQERASLCLSLSAPLRARSHEAAAQ